MIGPNTTVKTQRRADTETDKSSFPVTYILEDIPAYIEPASAELIAMSDIDNALSVFNMLCDLVDIIRNDKIIDSDGNEYLVEGVRPISDPIDSHMELLITKANV